MKSHDYEIYNAIKNDDLAYIASVRYEKPLDSLYDDDLPEIFNYVEYPIMFAAYFGAKKVFNFYTHTMDPNRLYNVCFFYLAFFNFF